MLAPLKATSPRLRRAARAPLSALLALLCLSACPGDDQVRELDPVVTITSPSPGELLTSRIVRVRGSAKHTDEVMVEGKPVSVVGGAWSAPVTVEEGEATVRVVARAAQDEVTFQVDATPPRLEITSPQRAAFFPASQDTVTVAGRALDEGTGVALVTINAQPVVPDAEGRFSLDVALQPGLNTLEVRAVDQAGHANQALLGALQGEYVDPSQSVEPGILFEVTESLIARTAEVISALLTPEQVGALLTAQFAEQGELTLREIDFEPVRITATPKDGAPGAGESGRIEFRVEVRQVVIKGEFTLSGNVVELDVALDEAVITTAMRLQANAQKSLDVAFDEGALELSEDALSWTVRSAGVELSESDSRVLKRLVNEIVQVGFSQILNERLIEQLYDPALLQRRVTLLGRTLAFDLQIEQVLTNASGVFLRASFAMPQERFEQLPDSPGALVIPMGARDNSGLSRDALVTLDENATNRLLHGVWQSGLMNQSLRGADFAGMELPFALETGALALLLDGRITNYADNGAPAGITLRPQLPGVIEFKRDELQSAQDAVIARFGELHVDLLLDVESASPRKLATFALFLDLGVSVQVTEDNLIGIALSFKGRTDLIDEPLFDLDDEATEELMESLFALIPSLLSEQIVLNGEADLEWLSLREINWAIHGIQGDQLSLGLNVEANPEAISLSFGEQQP